MVLSSSLMAHPTALTMLLLLLNPHPLPFITMCISIDAAPDGINHASPCVDPVTTTATPDMKIDSDQQERESDISLCQW